MNEDSSYFFAIFRYRSEAKITIVAEYYRPEIAWAFNYLLN